ncbi:glycine-rich RNA-binding protein RZ1C-like [Alnus glutinosa]|uniref:glycine-rich RNA-binding protein RZ1C-like n=1 Tax=Alnus glutinosa TaxID=3517 RepID=UPI002D7650FB|nr:glycine-rich RNA-binding protein RZ1C-like [Alnus glutinosa]
MAAREDNRIFVGGLAWETTEKHLEAAFSVYGKVLQALVVVDRDTGRPRGFGFVTFVDHRAMDDAIRDMDGQELDGHVISVNKAKPKMGGQGPGYEYERDRISGGRDSYRSGDRSAGHSDCFKCGRPGHFARECPSVDAGRGSGGRLFSNSSFGGGGGRGDRFGSDRYDDRYDGGRFGDSDRMHSKEDSYDSRDRYSHERYPPGGDRFAGERYVDRAPQTGYGKDKGYDRDGGLRGGSDRYGSGRSGRYDRGSYRERSGPYDRPSAAGRPSYDRY